MTQTNKTHVVKFLCTPNEFVRLKNKADYSGFVSISQYIRFIIFSDFATEKMIKEIHERIVLEGGEKK